MIVATARRRSDSGYTHDVEVDGHELVIDEPTELGGTDLGPSPMRVVACGLAACAAATVELYAARKGWDLGRVEASASYQPDKRGTVERFEVVVRVSPELDAEQIDRILTIAGKCPVHRVLSRGGGVEIVDHIERLP